MSGYRCRLSFCQTMWEDGGVSPLDTAQLPPLACGTEGKLGVFG